MICFSLTCSKDHSFDSWFSKSQDFETLRAAQHLCCPVCGDTAISKALMAPTVASPQPVGAAAKGQTPPAPALSAPQSDTEKALAQMRAAIEQQSDYVGLNFAAEARAMHEGDTPARPIYGEAKIEEARALLEDGIPVAPLPFMPRAKVN